MSEAAFQMDNGWLEFNSDPSVPDFKVPAGAIDAHCHVFGPGDVFPYAPTRKYTPCDASKDQLFALRDHLGFERSVIVQATCHGADNRALVDAIAHSDGKARGVATVSRAISDDELCELDSAGVRGVRFSFVKRLVDVLPHDTLTEVAERIQPLGWHLVIYVESQDLSDLSEFFASLPGTMVFDHMARPDVTQAVNGKAFDQFMRLLADNENMWTKVSCPERLTLTGPPGYDDVVPFAKRVVEIFPDRTLWGTDWPHPNMTSHMPDEGKLVDFIPRIAVSDELQRKLLVDNPMRLYWPEEFNNLDKPYADIPGTTIFDADQARMGYHLNQFCMSLMKVECRERFKSDERAYLDVWPMTEDQKQAVLDRDYNRMIELGGNVYFLAKIFLSDGQSFEQAAAAMTGVTREEYRKMMLSGGRSPEGNRYKREQ